MIAANDPTLRSWISVEAHSDFPIQNLPFGIAENLEGTSFVASIIGNTIINLAALHKEGYFKGIDIEGNVFEQSYLNDFISLGKTVGRSVRQRLSDLFREDTSYDVRENASNYTHNIEEVKLLMPVKVGDYTDFYSSREHATNVGSMFRDPENALLPNWLHLPVGYHGRASSIVVSGTPVIRPKGQQMPQGAEKPVFGPSKLLDFELEMAFVVGKPTLLGETVSVNKAEEFIFGMVLFNDWSARDIQKWEYVPLGPFLGKSFASTISPWIVTLDALEPFRVNSPEQQPEVLPYLKYEGKGNFDIELEVYIQPDENEATKVCHSNFKHMYWNISQQLAHHTVNGCNINVGDMMASGTISGPTKESYGSMLELSWRGTQPLKMNDGSERKFINDGDTVIMKGYAQRDGIRIGFGESKGTVLPAI